MRALQERGPICQTDSGAVSTGAHPLRVLQLSDPHLLRQGRGRYRGRTPLAQLRHGLEQALAALGDAPDLLLISGDLCQDESWGGYVQLRELLTASGLPLALLPGNHDHPALLQAALGRHAVLAPAELRLGPWRLLLLSSHRSGDMGGWLGSRQRDWLRQRLRQECSPALVVVHHPPLPIGDPGFDSIRLRDGAELAGILLATSSARLLLCGHVHQHWQGLLGGQDRQGIPVLACPSTLCSFGAVQPCPMGRPEDPGGRLLELYDDGRWSQRLLRWSPWPEPAATGCAT
ncbi:3',5'-cyclic adenosine monophosphate phosphodiesterase CpdA [Synechococcus sp. CBW1107]|nr:3',5'-cyclic adenosine monophosphate phosphodiesterase CpdA [Synechococcus sp. CBW1107]